MLYIAYIIYIVLYYYYIYYLYCITHIYIYFVLCERIYIFRFTTILSIYYTFIIFTAHSSIMSFILHILSIYVIIITSIIYQIFQSSSKYDTISSMRPHATNKRLASRRLHILGSANLVSSIPINFSPKKNERKKDKIRSRQTAQLFLLLPTFPTHHSHSTG